MKKTLLVALLSAAVFSASAAPVVYDPDHPSVAIPLSQYPDVVEKAILAKDYARALDVIRLGLEQNPKSAELRFQRCVTYGAMGKTGQAKSCYEDMIRTYPEIANPYNNLAAIYSEVDGDLDKAEELLKRCINLNPGNATAYANLAGIYLVRARDAYQESSNRRSDRTLLKKIEVINNLIAAENH